ncbi:hypothetical protein L209DRAFT_777663 [Thermothelomyces heterothallicus CBS 203.75]
MSSVSPGVTSGGRYAPADKSDTGGIQADDTLSRLICVGRDNSCYRDDTGEECCQRAPNPPLHWCSGDFPNFRCYNPKNQFCCTNGKVCDEKDCCALFVQRVDYPPLVFGPLLHRWPLLLLFFLPRYRHGYSGANVCHGGCHC